MQGFVHKVCQMFGLHYMSYLKKMLHNISIWTVHFQNLDGTIS